MIWLISIITAPISRPGIIPAANKTGFDFLRCVTSSVITNAYAITNKLCDPIPTGSI